LGRTPYHKKQGHEFCFLNRSRETYEWNEVILEDDLDFQGFLEEEEAPFPDVSAEFPGLLTEEEEEDFQVVPDEPGLGFEDLVAAAFENSGINMDDCIRATWATADAAAAVAALHPTHHQPRLIKADPDSTVYNITFELPDAGLLPMATCPLSLQKPLRIPAIFYMVLQECSGEPIK
jgi:hypothetical protein